MVSQAGWIKLYRKAFDWQWYTDVPVKVLFFHLLLKANHKEGKWRDCTLQRGELITSLEHLSSETGLTASQVRTALKKLQKSGEIEVSATNRFTHIKCCRYSFYQDSEEAASQADDVQSASPSHTPRKPFATDKKEKNKKRYKNEIRISTKPSFDIEEIKRRSVLNDDFDI